MESHTLYFCVCDGLKNCASTQTGIECEKISGPSFYGCFILRRRDFLPRGSGIVTRRPLLLKLLHTKDGGEHDAHWDHEAILGSHKEAEEFDDLSPVEAKKRLAVLAAKMDRNSDGFVDKTELHQWIVRSFRMLSREDSDEVS